MRIHHAVGIFSLLFLIFAVGCTKENPDEKRRKAVLKNSQQLVIGVSSFGSGSRDAFSEGVFLRAEEINEGGGLLGRKIKLVTIGAETMNPSHVGQAMVDVADMSAAITRLGLEVEMPIAVMLQFHGMVMVSGSRDGTGLTALGFSRVFHGFPDVKKYAERFASFCQERDFDSVVVISGLGEFERNMADMFELAARDADVYIPERIPLGQLGGARTHQFMSSELKKERADAFLLAVAPDEILDAVSVLRKAGFTLPLLVMPLVREKDFLGRLGDQAGTLYTLAPYSETIPDKISEHFTQAYQSKYATDPILTAAEGYDTVSLLAEAVKMSGSPVPDMLAEKLSDITGFDGANGTIGFNGQHNLTVNRLYILQNRGNMWALDEDKQVLNN